MVALEGIQGVHVQQAFELLHGPVLQEAPARQEPLVFQHAICRALSRGNVSLARLPEAMDPNALLPCQPPDIAGAARTAPSHSGLLTALRLRPRRRRRVVALVVVVAVVGLAACRARRRR